ncbi:MAG: MBL fold metallo-hydrolase [Bacilli bacterium]|nr:MBL fold metallo-hydrolase [Bacilli bacterium]
MKFKILIDDRSNDEQLFEEHGMSILLETANHHILFDMGKTHLFMNNAIIKKWNLKIIDIAIVSHGHIDHCGGLSYFLDMNHHADVYIQKKAMGHFYSLHHDGLHDISFPHHLIDDSKLQIIEGNLKIDSIIQLFQTTKRDLFWPSLNCTLFEKKESEMCVDSFEHEQYAIILEGNLSCLISGCSHCGICNIVEEAKILLGYYPNIIIGGFHFASDSRQEIEEKQIIIKTAEYLKKTSAHIYTMHCTGEKPFTILKEVLGKQIELVTTGEERTIENYENCNSI